MSKSLVTKYDNNMWQEYLPVDAQVLLEWNKRREKPEKPVVFWKEVGVGMLAELIVSGDGPEDSSNSSIVGS